jgi:hypothetical protein
MVTSLHLYLSPESGPDDPDRREFDWEDCGDLIDIIPDEVATS